jgi:hypothetical protein
MLNWLFTPPCCAMLQKNLFFIGWVLHYFSCSLCQPAEVWLHIQSTSNIRSFILGVTCSFFFVMYLTFIFHD